LSWAFWEWDCDVATVPFAIHDPKHDVFGMRTGCCRDLAGNLFCRAYGFASHLYDDVTYDNSFLVCRATRIDGGHKRTLHILGQIALFAQLGRQSADFEANTRGVLGPY
jgi:hypothetical protein